MSATDRLSDFFRLDGEYLHELGKKGLWLSLFVGLLGIAFVGFAMLVFFTAGVSFAGEDSVFLDWISSRGISLAVTLILIVPIVRALRWISIRLGRSSEYVRAVSDPLFGLILIAFGVVSILVTVPALETQPNVDTLLGVILMSGYYFVFAGIATAAAMSWIFGFTTITLYFKYFRVDQVISKITDTFQILLAITVYPNLFYRYAKDKGLTFVGAMILLIKKGGGAIALELNNYRTQNQESDEENQMLAE